MLQYRHKVRKEEEAEERGTMVIVRDRSMEALNEALRRFRKKVEAAEIMEDWHKASYYIKPSKRKREKRFANAKLAQAARAQYKRNSENKAQPWSK